MLSGDERSSGSQVTMADEAGEGTQSDLLGELARLREEHRDLDSAIEALERSVAGDQLQIQRLKKRKLTLRDRIYHIEDALTPDIIA
ncbi:YdcH family protein [Methylobacterium sp. D53M]